MSSAGNVEPDDARHMVTIKKRNFTRQFNGLGKLTQFAGQNPTPFAAAEIEASSKKLHKTFGELCDALDTMVTVDPKFEDEHEVMMTEQQERFEEMVQRTIMCLKDINTPPQPAPAAAPAAPAPLSLIHI